MNNNKNENIDLYDVYYDESNNYRKVYLSDGKLNIASDDNFVLGGIVLKHHSEQFSLDDVKNELEIKNPIDELKAKYVFNGKFIQILNSYRLNKFFHFLENHDISIHFLDLNILYWAIIDIIESILQIYDNKQLLRFGNCEDEYDKIRMQFINDLYQHNLIASDANWDEIVDAADGFCSNYIQRYCTSVFLEIIKEDKDQFIKCLDLYNFPHVEYDKRKQFIDEIKSFAIDNRNKIEYYSKLKGNELDILINACVNYNNQKLDFIEDESPKILFDNFSFFYHYIPSQLTNLEHYFDQEETIRPIIESNDYLHKIKMERIHFINSINDIKIQLSDVVAGFLAKYWTFINNTKISELKCLQESFEERQKDTLSILAKLIIKTDNLSLNFSRRIDSLYNCQKSDIFLGTYLNYNNTQL